MNDTQIILEALKKPLIKSKPSKTRLIPEIEEFAGPKEKDLIWNTETSDKILIDLATKYEKNQNKTKTKSNKKYITQWTNKDFALYFDGLLKIRGFSLERLTIQETEDVARLYDKFVILVPDMSNKILRDYLDWWSLYCLPSIKIERIYLNTLLNDKYIDKFCTLLSSNELSLKKNGPNQISKAKNNLEKPLDIDDESMYNMGGVVAVLTAVGIVKTCALLKRKGIISTLSISEQLRKMPKKVFSDCFNLTLSLSPYPETDKVDFISVAKQAIDYHGFNKFLKINYKEFFLNYV